MIIDINFLILKKLPENFLVPFCSKLIRGVLTFVSISVYTVVHILLEIVAYYEL